MRYDKSTIIGVLYSKPHNRFIEIKRNLRRKNLHRANRGSNFLGGSFSNRDNVRIPIQFRREEIAASQKMTFLQEETHPFSH